MLDQRFLLLPGQRLLRGDDVFDVGMAAGGIERALHQALMIAIGMAMLSIAAGSLLYSTRPDSDGNEISAA